MANWYRLAKKLALADGVIDDREANIIKAELLEDGKIDRAEAEFLLELKQSARAVCPTFEHFWCQVVKKLVLRDGRIDDAEAIWLAQRIMAHRSITPQERQLLEELKREAKSVGKEFEKLYAIMAKG